MTEEKLTFWDHLEELRGVLFRIAVSVIGVMAVAFCFKETLFNIILAPKKCDFITFQLFEKSAQFLGFSELALEKFDVSLINTQLTSQFLIHMSAAFYAGIIIASPYIIYQLFRFISPALYENEKKYSLYIIAWGYLLFMAGVLLNYFLIFPLSFRFLATYQVSGEVENMISLSSYMDTLMMLSIMMGILFQLPIICWLLSKFGLLSSKFMKKYRRHAIIIIMIIAAIITPTSDIFTLVIVGMPIYLLYELSIIIVKRSSKQNS